MALSRVLILSVLLSLGALAAPGGQTNSSYVMDTQATTETGSPADLRIPPLSPARMQALTSNASAIDFIGEINTLNCLNTSSITAFAIRNNLVIFTGANDFSAQQKVRITGLSRGTYMNGATITLLSVTPNTFTAVFSHSDVTIVGDQGTAVRTDCVPQVRS